MTSTKQGNEISPIIMDAFSWERRWREKSETEKRKLRVVIGPTRFPCDVSEAVEIQCVEPETRCSLGEMLLLRDPVLTEAAMKKFLSFARLALEMELKAPFRFEIVHGAYDDDAVVVTAEDILGECYHANLYSTMGLWNELVAEIQLTKFDDGAFPYAMDPAETAEWLSQPSKVGLITDADGGLLSVSCVHLQEILNVARWDGRAILGGMTTIDNLLGEAVEDFFDIRQLRLAALEHFSEVF